MEVEVNAISTRPTASFTFALSKCCPVSRAPLFYSSTHKQNE